MNNETGLEQCKRLIEASLGWGDPASWTNEDFDELSDRIFEKTTVRLSVSTLKRIWGKVKYEHSPTTATLNVLARHAGFGGWRDFLSRSSPQTMVQEPQPKPARSLILTPLIISAVVVGCLLALLSARLIHPPTKAPPLRFEGHPTSDDLPNSVVFDYDATPLDPKEVIIQQSWDPQRREKVDPNGKQHTSIYYYPGYFSAKLIVDGTIRRQSEVFVTTKGWKAIVGHNPYPIYLSREETKSDSGRLGVTAATLAEKTGSSVFSGAWVAFADVRPFSDMHGDHFSFSTSLRNTSTVEQCLCRNIRITLLGKNSAIIIPLSDKGCIAGLKFFPGFKPQDGRDHDLSAFGCDFRQWQRLVCTEKERVITITLNGLPVFRAADAVSIGDIVGLNIDFEGTGVIREAVLQGSGAPIDLLADASSSPPSGTPYK
jgi:hypothetical protein